VFFLRTKQNEAQTVSRLMDQLWNAVVAHGSQDLAIACNIQGEWLTKEMLALAYSGALDALGTVSDKTWQPHLDGLQTGLRLSLVQELVAFLNEIEWQIGPWLEGVKGGYGAVANAQEAGKVFFGRVAATEQNTDVQDRIEAAGAATYQTVFTSVAALPKKIKVI